MKLNEEWQKQWDQIEVPEAKLTALIETTLRQESPKASSRYRRSLSWLSKHKLRTGAVLLVAAALVFLVPQLYQNAKDQAVDSSLSMRVEKAYDGGGLSEFQQEAANGGGAAKSQEADKSNAAGAAEGEAAVGADSDSKTTAGDKTAFFYTIEKETTIFDEDLAAVNELVEKTGGYLADSNVTAYSDHFSSRYAEMTLKIPAEQQGAFLEQLEAIGKTTEESLTSENYALQYSDNESRIEALETEETALLELLAKSDTTEDMLKIQERLSVIRAEKESLVRSNRSIDNQVDYTSVTLTLREITKIESNEKSESVTTKIQNNWHKQLNFWKNLIAESWIFLASNVFYLALLAAIGVIGVIIFRKKAKK